MVVLNRRRKNWVFRTLKCHFSKLVQIRNWVCPDQRLSRSESLTVHCNIGLEWLNIFSTITMNNTWADITSHYICIDWTVLDHMWPKDTTCKECDLFVIPLNKSFLMFFQFLPISMADILSKISFLFCQILIAKLFYIFEYF